MCSLCRSFKKFKKWIIDCKVLPVLLILPQIHHLALPLNVAAMGNLQSGVLLQIQEIFFFLVVSHSFSLRSFTSGRNVEEWENSITTLWMIATQDSISSSDEKIQNFRSKDELTRETIIPCCGSTSLLFVAFFAGCLIIYFIEMQLVISLWFIGWTKQNYFGSNGLFKLRLQ